MVAHGLGRAAKRSSCSASSTGGWQLLLWHCRCDKDTQELSVLEDQSITQDAFCDFQIRAKRVGLGGKGKLVTGKGVTHGTLGPEEAAADAGFRRNS